MKLDDFLKCKKVRCVNGVAGITTGKVYDVIGLDENYVHVIDDDGKETHYWYCRFEPVLDSAENPLQEMKLTPEFETEASEPKLKVGDKVYYPSFSHEICIIRLGVSDDLITLPNDDTILAAIGTDLGFSYNDKEKIWEWGCGKSAPAICHATPENYKMLCKLYPHIKFEAPPKPLTGSDLARAMVDKGWFIVDCYVSAISDEDALRFRTKRMQVALFGDGLFTDGVKQFPFAVPFDPRTGEPLTESILKD